MWGILWAMAVSGGGWAAEPLSLADALTEARGGAPAVLQAQVGVDAAAGSLLSARARFEPVLSERWSTFSSRSEGTFQFGPYSSDAEGWSNSLSLVQPLPVGTTLTLGLEASRSQNTFRLPDANNQEFANDPQYATALSLQASQPLLQGAGVAASRAPVAAAEAGVTLAEWQARQQAQTALQQVASAWWALALAEDRARIASQSVALAAEQDRVVRQLLDAGRLAPVEGTRSGTALAQAQKSALEAEAARVQAGEALAVALGRAPSALQTRRSEAAWPAPPSVEAVMEGVLAGNPELQLVRLQQEAAALQVSLAKNQRLPELSATGGYTLNGYDTTLEGARTELAGGDLRDWNLGANAQLPLANRADRGALQSRQADAERLRLEEAALLQRLEQEARDALRRLGLAEEALRLARLQASLAEQTLAAEQARFLEGRALQRDVLAAAQEVETARIGLATAEMDRALAVVALQRLQGAL